MNHGGIQITKHMFKNNPQCIDIERCGMSANATTLRPSHIVVFVLLEKNAKF